MDPTAALQAQIAPCRAMTGEQRLAIGMALFELACALAREGIRAQRPDADGVEVDRLLRQRLELAHRPWPKQT